MQRQETGTIAAVAALAAGGTLLLARQLHARQTPEAVLLMEHAAEHARRPGALATVAALAIGGMLLSGKLRKANGHAGKTGNIYVVAIYQGSIFAHNGTSWAAWSGTTTLPAYASNVSLTDRSINVLDKLDVSSIVGTTILVGYASSYEDLIATQAYDVVHTVQ